MHEPVLAPASCLARGVKRAVMIARVKEGVLLATLDHWTNSVCLGLSSVPRQIRLGDAFPRLRRRRRVQGSPCAG